MMEGPRILFAITRDRFFPGFVILREFVRSLLGRI